MLARLLTRLALVGAAVMAAGVGLAVTVAVLAPQVRDFFTSASAGPDKPVNLEPLASRTVIYGSDGSVLFELHDEVDRIPVPLDKVPAHVVTAVLDAEDERYWDHGALDGRALLRALVSNLKSGEVLEGGSTITQQLVKTSLLTPKRDLQRKLEEAVLALRLTRQMSKEEVLERYLNTVYFGAGAYGLQAAALRYFNTNVTQLTMGQGVLLASLIRSPGADPFTAPDAATSRRNAVIDRMLFLGHLSADEADALMVEPLPEPGPERPARGTDYFVEAVKQQLLGDARFNLGDTVQERTQSLFKGGYSIVTTLNPAFQRAAEEKVTQILPDSGGVFTAALVSVDVKTGAVRALVGGPDFSKAQFNLVTQGGRQTGSSFKTLTLVAALESGYLVNDRISGVAPCEIPNPGGEDDPWKVRNSEGAGGYVMSLTDATVYSVNCAYARLVKLVGPTKVADVAQRMGVTSNLPKELSLTLGAASVSPLEMASAYATLAADGIHRTPYLVDRIVDRSGKVVFQALSQNSRATTVQVARSVTQVLTEVVTRGTGGAAAVPGWQVAGKTGSTDENTDAWFVGYTPELATAVWMGSPAARVPMNNVGGIRVYGGTYPATIWGSYMREILAGRPPVPFARPEDVITRPSRQLVLADERVVVPTAPLSPGDASSPGQPNLPFATTPTTDRDRLRPRDATTTTVDVRR